MPNLLSIKFFIPELILSAAALILLFMSLWRRVAGFAGGFVLAVLGLALVAILMQWNIGSPPLFWGLLALGNAAVFFKVIFIVSAMLVVLFSQRSKKLADSGDMPEYYSLIVGMVVGMSLLCEAQNILMIYLSLEFVSLMSYLLTGYIHNSPRSSEAALKYVLYGAVASGVFLFGASLYYGLTGSLDVGSLNAGQVMQSRAAYSLGGILMLAGFLYKTAAVPMHAWCPDAYEGAPTPVTALLSVAPKAAGFAVLMRVAAAIGVDMGWPIIIAVISAVTMTYGNLVAIPQNNLKRLLAYSSIAHAGYILMGVACATPKGNEAVYFYFVAYLLMNMGAFLVVQIMADHFGGESIDSYCGLAQRGAYGAMVSIAMTIFLLSLTGVPPFIGFIGKFYIFSAVIEARLYWLAVAGIINSVISLYYYARIIKAMFFDNPADDIPLPMASRQLTAIMVSLAAAVTVLGLAWQWIAEMAKNII